ncbi:hypothetical protein [Ancylobacter sp. SL191]|uniref:hypothetical protein n=1 Tax=Ancylobacter sp. SL191 TaxID=2995166 RepID=UPI002270CC27|nr:hypothetical protein [Ancylobacter sp. SL191]WAC25757.1 hypothetical protein OU996_12020 [Ancylobacter sp. SL191]
MAKLPALVDALAQHDPRGLAAVNHYARIVREAGFLPTTKRGNGASDMGEREVVNLLLGLAEVTNAQKAPRAIKVLRDAKLVGPLPDHPDPIERLAGFELEGHLESLGDFLECLVRNVSDGGYVLASEDARQVFLLSEIILKAPDYWDGHAIVRFNAGHKDELSLTFYGLTDEANSLGQADEDPADIFSSLNEESEVQKTQFGLSFTVRIGAEVVSDLARCLRAQRKIAPRRRSSPQEITS